MSSTVAGRPFPAISQSLEVWRLSLDVGAKIKPQRLRSIRKPKLSTTMFICHKTIMKIEVIHQNYWARESQEQWKHLKFRKSLGYELYKIQCYRHININLLMLIPQQFLLVLAVCFTVSTQEIKLYHWKQQVVHGAFKEGDHCWHFLEDKTLAHKRNRIWDPHACGTCFHAWKPCSSTAFLTLASHVGSRSFGSTHTDTGDCLPRQEAGHQWRSPSNQPLQLLAALQRELGAAPRARPLQASHGSVKLRIVTSEHRLHLHNHHTATVLYSL